MERLENLLQRLKLYPDLQKEIISIVCEHAKQSSDIALEYTPKRLGLKRQAADKVKEYLSSLEQTAIKTI